MTLTNQTAQMARAAQMAQIAQNDKTTRKQDNDGSGGGKTLAYGAAKLTRILKRPWISKSGFRINKPHVYSNCLSKNIFHNFMLKFIPRNFSNDIPKKCEQRNP